jgi:hypothetical protein
VIVLHSAGVVVAGAAKIVVEAAEDSDLILPDTAGALE